MGDTSPAEQYLGQGELLHLQYTVSMAEPLFTQRQKVVRMYTMHLSSISMMTSSTGKGFRVTGLLCGEFTGHRWIPLSKTRDAELSCFFWCAWIIDTPVIWDAIALIITSLLCLSGMKFCCRTVWLSLSPNRALRSHIYYNDKKPLTFVATVSCIMAHLRTYVYVHTVRCRGQATPAACRFHIDRMTAGTTILSKSTSNIFIIFVLHIFITIK